MHSRTTAALAALGLTAIGTLHAADPPALRSLVPKGLLIGAAINEKVADGRAPALASLVQRHFNSVTNENLLKWERVHPEPDRYVFDPVDRYIAFGQQHGMKIIGHTLVWHQQTPAWVFAGAGGGRADRALLLERMRSHIHAVAGRYKGRIHGWDVVNEALDEDGSLRKTPWLEIIGDDFIAKAFEYAREADPDAELYYNDYNLWKPAKREAAVRLVERLRSQGLRVDGIGEQAHWGLDAPPIADVEATITGLAASGVKVLLTELDVDVLPRDPEMWGADLSKKAKIKAATNIYPDGLPPEQQQRLARYYADVFTLVLKHRASIARVTFWGVTDADSWLNNFPIPGRVNYPLLWDRQGQPKPAFDAVVSVLKG